MKKHRLKARIARLEAANAELTAEVEHMRARWRPVPIHHEWQPRNPLCELCDQPRDAARHQVEP